MKEFEGSIKRLEEIVELLNDNQVSLQEGLDLLEEGVNLIKECNLQLEQGKGKLQKLLFTEQKISCQDAFELDEKGDSNEL